MMLFNAKLSDKDSWLIARETSAYSLIKHIAVKEHLPGVGQRIGPSTNLICRFGDRILKIFAPAVCGYQALEDFSREIFGLMQFQDTTLHVPHIFSSGCIHDRYDFYYLVMERLDIPPASKFLDTCTLSQLSRFGETLLDGIKCFQDIHTDVSLSKTFTSNSRLQQERDARLETHKAGCLLQFIHADLSGDNVLYDGERLAIIDFEDWTYGAPAIELPEIIFGLLHGIRANIEAFFSRPLNASFIDEIFEGLLYHYNWERFINRYCMRNGHRPTSLTEARAVFLSNV